MRKPDPLSDVSLGELRRQVLRCSPPEAAALLSRLAQDPRVGARALADQLERRLERERTRHHRGASLLERERELTARGFRCVAGVDEAGLGPLAGPVIAAAAVLRHGPPIPGLDDSKRLSARAREELVPLIRDRSRSWALGEATAAEVDALNVRAAGLLAMRRAVEALDPAADYLLVDARDIPGVDVPQEAHVRGDARHHAIAAASVLAKVHRDRLMTRLDRRYPGYGFARHKGYATAAHLESLRRLGPSPVHRWSFAPVAAQDPAEARRRLAHRLPRQSVLFG
jgi:ribonuclease HII